MNHQPMKRFKIIYFDENDSKHSKIFRALNEDNAIEQAKQWLLYNTTYQLAMIHDCIELKQRKIKMKTLTKHQQKNLRIYDNNGKTFDQYTAVYMDQPERQDGIYAARGMSEFPFDPQGFGIYCTAMPGRHLGKRIKFEDCPIDVQKCILQDLED